MIPFHPIVTLFQIGNIEIYMWASMVALGILAGSLLILKEAKRKGVSQEKTLYSLIITIICFIVGMKLFYNIFVAGRTGWRALDIIHAGSASYGAAIGLIVGIVISALIFKIKIWKLLDLISIGSLLGAIFVRAGCHLSGDGCSWGKVMDKVMPWAIHYEDAIRHPTALYELCLTIPLFILIWKFRRKFRKEGYQFLSVLGGYFLVRLVVNQFRRDMDPLLQIAPLFVVIVIALVGLGLWLVRRKRDEKTPKKAR